MYQSATAHSRSRHQRKIHITTHTDQPGTNSANRGVTVERRLSTETKASFKTTEFFAYVAAVIGVLGAPAIVDATDFGSQDAWFFVTLLTIGYMVSRGLAKSGSRVADADRNSDHN